MVQGRVLACLNGPVDRADHPRVPVTPAEIVADAMAAHRAGAWAVHVHPRDAWGRETLDPDVIDTVVADVKRAVPGLPVGVSTGAWIEPDARRRAELVGRWTKPDFASVNLSEPGHAHVMATLLDAGIGIEAGVFDPGDVRRLTLSGFVDDVVRVLVEPSAGNAPEDVMSGAEQVALAAAIERALTAAAVTAPRLQHGTGAGTWSVLRAAIAHDRDVRIGLEDTLVGPDGRPAASNAELVRQARALLP